MEIHNGMRKLARERSSEPEPDLGQIIKAHNFARAKVPLKVAVIKDDAAQNGPLKVQGYAAGVNNGNGREFYSFDIDSHQVEGLWAEKITPSNRKLSRDELDELVTVVAESKFGDFGTLRRPNILVAENGFYFVDTEFTSFQGRPEWAGLWEILQPFVDSGDTQYFQDKLQAKHNEEQRKPRYMDLRSILTSLQEELADKPDNEKLQQRIANTERKIAALTLVGGEKSSLFPNQFSFPMSEIIK